MKSPFKEVEQCPESGKKDVFVHASEKSRGGRAMP